MIMLLEKPGVGTGVNGATATMNLDCAFAEIGERRPGIVASGDDASRLDISVPSPQGNWALTAWMAPSRAVRTFIWRTPLGGTVAMIQARLPCCWVK